MAYQSLKIDLNTKVNWSLINRSPENWRDHICNDFESVFSKQYDQFDEVKSALYLTGADYVSLTGTGSTIYAIFKKRKDIDLKHIGLRSKWINL